MLTSAILAGAAAQAVNARGEFVLPLPAAGAVPMLSEAEARAHAAAWVHDFGPYNRTHLEERHGGRIDFARLTRCPRSYLAATPYADVAADAHPGIRNFHGPQWLVSLCAPGGAPVVSVAVAAYATNNVALENGDLVWRGSGGNEYFVQGIPPGRTSPGRPSAPPNSPPAGPGVGSLPSPSSSSPARPLRSTRGGGSRSTPRWPCAP